MTERTFGSRKMWLWIWAAASVLVVGLYVWGQNTAQTREMTCSELTAEMLEMTGADAAVEDYDIDRVREINDARDQKGCG